MNISCGLKMIFYIIAKRAIPARIANLFIQALKKSKISKFRYMKTILTEENVKNASNMNSKWQVTVYVVVDFSFSLFLPTF